MERKLSSASQESANGNAKSDLNEQINSFIHKIDSKFLHRDCEEIQVGSERIQVNKKSVEEAILEQCNNYLKKKENQNLPNIIENNRVVAQRGGMGGGGGKQGRSLAGRSLQLTTKETLEMKNKRKSTSKNTYNNKETQKNKEASTYNTINNKSNKNISSNIINNNKNNNKTTSPKNNNNRSNNNIIINNPKNNPNNIIVNSHKNCTNIKTTTTTTNNNNNNNNTNRTNTNASFTGSYGFTSERDSRKDGMKKSSLHSESNQYISTPKIKKRVHSNKSLSSDSPAFASQTTAVQAAASQATTSQAAASQATTSQAAVSQAATSQATVSRTAVSRTAVSRTALSREAGPFAQQRKQQNNCTWRLNSWKLSHINDLEDELKRHPLALYPHLEEYIPYNVFEEVVELLDPEMKKSIDTEVYVDPYRLDDFSEVFQFDAKDYGLEEKEEERMEENLVINATKPHKARRGEKPSAYRAIFKHDEKQQNISRYSKTKYTALDVTDDEKKTTKEFCEYLETLAIDENDLVSESVVAGFFNNGFDTKPPLTVAVEFIDMEGVSLELRRLTGGPDANDEDLKLQESCSTFVKRLRQMDTETSRKMVGKRRYRFGAWYLEPKTWRKVAKGEALMDPKLVRRSGEVKEAASDEVNSELAVMRGTKLFVEFAMSHNKRKPQFLEDVIKLMPDM